MKVFIYAFINAIFKTIKVLLFFTLCLVWAFCSMSAVFGPLTTGNGDYFLLAIPCIITGVFCAVNGDLCEKYVVWSFSNSIHHE